MKKILLIITVSLPMMLYAQQNSQWRGANRDGVYNETGLLKVWPANGPELLWHFDGLGAGFTSAAIASEKIYITGLTDDKLMLYVLDLKGKLLNKKEVGKERDTRYPGTRSSVTVNDGKLYIFNALGNFYCLNETTLNVVWEKNLTTDFDGKSIMLGLTENSLIVGDMIFLTPGGVRNNVVALNKNTGALIWSSPGAGMPSTYCSPIYIGDQSIPIIVTCFEGIEQGRDNYQNTIAAFNARTGEMLWSHLIPSQNDINPNIPIYSDGMIFYTTGYRGGSWLFRLKDGGRAAELVWKNSEMDNQMGSAIRIGDYIYGSGHQNNSWFCLDWKTGKTIYKTLEVGRSNIITADGMLYSYSERGTMYLIKPNPEKFELISSFPVTLGTDQHWAHPVIHRGVLYIRHGDALMAYKVRK
ncbi:MAG: PQQ-binding-like beta-propeller repeat protein [Tannerella sp.]|jgi:outer membrane protein assembly factor BamB|nr:PQQ-binding-like beta-propeller repeat protein [Tannerella sp.]